MQGYPANPVEIRTDSGGGALCQRFPVLIPPLSWTTSTSFLGIRRAGALRVRCIPGSDCACGSPIGQGNCRFYNETTTPSDDPRMWILSGTVFPRPWSGNSATTRPWQWPTDLTTPHCGIPEPPPRRVLRVARHPGPRHEQNHPSDFTVKDRNTGHLSRVGTAVIGDFGAIGVSRRAAPDVSSRSWATRT